MVSVSLTFTGSPGLAKAGAATAIADAATVRVNKVFICTASLKAGDISLRQVMNELDARAPVPANVRLPRPRTALPAAAVS